MTLATPTPPGTPEPVPRRDRIRLTHEHVGSSILVVTVDGEIDAANALSLSKYVEPWLETTSRVIVDLGTLGFFGTQAFSILHRLNVMCSRHNVNWVVVSGPEVDRLLRICDPDGGLPVAATLDDAIAAVTRPPRSHLRLVSG